MIRHKKTDNIKTMTDFSKATNRNWEYIYKPYIIRYNINSNDKKENYSSSNKFKKEFYPNTKRTIIPDFAPIDIFRRQKKEVINLKIQKEEKIFPTKKKVDISKLNFCTNNNSSIKKGKLCDKFKEHTYSHISNIPGPCNLKAISINEDIKNNEKYIRKSKSINHLKKLKNDFSSNINCLTNSLNNKNFKIDKKGKHYNYFKSNENYKKYKNKESYTTFYMLKPSDCYDIKYINRKFL